MSMVRSHFNVQRLSWTVGQHNISRLDVVSILPRLHFPIYLMGGIFIFKEWDSSSSHVVEVIYIVNE